MITVTDEETLCRKINCLTGMCTYSEKSEMGQPVRCADPKTIEKSIWGADLLRYAQFPPNISRKNIYHSLSFLQGCVFCSWVNCVEYFTSSVHGDVFMMYDLRGSALAWLLL